MRYVFPSHILSPKFLLYNVLCYLNLSRNHIQTSQLLIQKEFSRNKSCHYRLEISLWYFINSNDLFLFDSHFNISEITTDYAVKGGCQISENMMIKLPGSSLCNSVLDVYQPLGWKRWIPERGWEWPNGSVDEQPAW